MTHEQLKQAIACGAKTVKELKLWDEAYAYVESWEKQLSDDDDSEEHY